MTGHERLAALTVTSTIINDYYKCLPWNKYNVVIVYSCTLLQYFNLENCFICILWKFHDGILFLTQLIERSVPTYICQWSSLYSLYRNWSGFLCQGMAISYSVITMIHYPWNDLFFIESNTLHLIAALFVNFI